MLQSASSYGIKSNLYAALIGLSGASWPLMGYDSVAHLMEETKSADTTAGKPMPYTLVASFVIGLVYLLALTLCIQVSSCCFSLSHMLCSHQQQQFAFGHGTAMHKCLCLLLCLIASSAPTTQFIGTAALPRYFQSLIS